MSASRTHRLVLEYGTEAVKADATEAEAMARVPEVWLAPIFRPRNGKNKVHLDECGRL